MGLAAEAEDGRRGAEHLGEVGKRRDADAAADEQRPVDVEIEAVAERAEDGELVAWLERAERARAGPDRDRSGRPSSPGGARQRLIGRGSTRPGGESMKNCPGLPGSSSPRSTRSSV